MLITLTKTISQPNESVNHSLTNTVVNIHFHSNLCCVGTIPFSANPESGPHQGPKKGLSSKSSPTSAPHVPNTNQVR